MSQEFIQHISYIIPFRHSCDKRYEGLLFTLSIIRSYFPEMEIILVEEDEESKIDIHPKLNVQKVFIKSNTPISIAKCYNIGTQHTEKDYLLFGDGDIFLSKEGYFELFDKMLEFEVVTPFNRGILKGVEITDFDQLQYKIISHRGTYSFAGGILMVRRKSFEKINGWNDDFIGWGYEDNAFTHLAQSVLTCASLDIICYHVDHPITYYSNEKKKWVRRNHKIYQSFSQINGFSIDRYLKSNNNKETKVRSYILAISILGDIKYLKKLIDSFLQTRDQSAHWEVVISDDHQSKELQECLKLFPETLKVTFYESEGNGVNVQMNQIIRHIQKSESDLVFCCSPKIEFIKEGWEGLYKEAIQYTEMDHLIYHDSNRGSFLDFTTPHQVGHLSAKGPKRNIRHHFFTLTKRLIDEVGFFDMHNFGKSINGLLDYSFRSCRAGFNSLEHPFDAKGSEDYIKLQIPFEEYLYKNNDAADKIREVNDRKNLLKLNRVHVPYNMYFLKDQKNRKNKKGVVRLTLADNDVRKIKSPIRLLKFGLKFLYNFSLRRGWYFIPTGYKRFGKKLSDLGSRLMHLEEK